MITSDLEFYFGGASFFGFRIGAGFYCRAGVADERREKDLFKNHSPFAYP